MPRPGPRPYECVRRVWHSDRHQPIRGSLIQEIFRIVSEIHSSKTRKNKEWQEKLPIVVLRAEEIMYSKANSEAEYMDLKTLWDRANDAINTIIRLDETTETTGDLLQPCIEAALHLGCTPRRASRSQRNNDSRCYLSPNTLEPTSNPSNILESTSLGNHTTNPQYMSSYSHLMYSTAIKPTHLHSEPHRTFNSYIFNKFPVSSENFPLHCHDSLPLDTFPASNLCSTYPLYYPDQILCDQTQFNCGECPTFNSEEPAETSTTKNYFPCVVEAPNNDSLMDISPVPDNSDQVECDLSLRLGTSSVQCPVMEQSRFQETDDAGSSISLEDGKLNVMSPRMENGFSFFPMGNSDGTPDSCLSKLSSKGRILSTEPTIRKRKATASHLLGNFVGSQSFGFNHLWKR